MAPRALIAEFHLSNRDKTHLELLRIYTNGHELLYDYRQPGGTSLALSNLQFDREYRFAEGRLEESDHYTLPPTLLNLEQRFGTCPAMRGENCVWDDSPTIGVLFPDGRIPKIAKEWIVGLSEWLTEQSVRTVVKIVW